MKKMAKFIIQNEQQVNRSKVCDVIMSDDHICRAFLRELLLHQEGGTVLHQEGGTVLHQEGGTVLLHQEGDTVLHQEGGTVLLHQEGDTVQMKGSPYVDEILREIFYFINIKVSDRIYRLLELLC